MRTEKLWLALLLWLQITSSAATERLQTWHPWQLDSLLVAWVLTQTQNPAPVFESVPRGTWIAHQSAIDTPDSPYRRTAQRTAFDEAVRLHGLTHACVPRLREAVRVVELAPWRKPEFPLVEAFEASVLAVLPLQPSVGGLEAAMKAVASYCTGGVSR